MEGPGSPFVIFHLIISRTLVLFCGTIDIPIFLLGSKNSDNFIDVENAHVSKHINYDVDLDLKF